MAAGDLILGLVSLSKPLFVCGCVPPDCCLYPAVTLDDPEYIADDLPDTVTYKGDTLSHVSGEYKFSGSVYYIVGADDGWELRLISDDTLIMVAQCLIGNGIEDEFPDTYLNEEYGIELTRSTPLDSIPLWPLGNIINFRTNKCTWAGPQEGTNGLWILWYGESQDLPIAGSGILQYGYNLALFYYDFETGFWIGNSTGKGYPFQVPQNTPAGEYNGSPVFFVNVS